MEIKRKNLFFLKFYFVITLFLSLSASSQILYSDGADIVLDEFAQITVVDSTKKIKTYNAQNIAEISKPDDYKNIKTFKEDLKKINSQKNALHKDSSKKSQQKKEIKSKQVIEVYVASFPESDFKLLFSQTSNVILCNSTNTLYSLVENVGIEILPIFFSKESVIKNYNKNFISKNIKNVHFTRPPPRYNNV